MKRAPLYLTRRLEFRLGVLPDQASQLDTPAPQHTRHCKCTILSITSGHQLCAKREAHADARPVARG